MAGAEKLLGNGDMLYLSGDSSKPRRLQEFLFPREKIKRVVNYIAEKNPLTAAENEEFEAAENNLRPNLTFSMNFPTDQTMNYLKRQKKWFSRPKKLRLRFYRGD